MQRNVLRQNNNNSLASTTTTTTTENTRRKRTRSTHTNESDGQSLSPTSNLPAVTKRQRNAGVSTVASRNPSRPVSQYRFRNRSQTVTRSSTPDPRQRLTSRRRQNQNAIVNHLTTSSSITTTTTTTLRGADNHAQHLNSDQLLPPINDSNRTRYNLRPRTQCQQQQVQAPPIRPSSVALRARPSATTRTNVTRTREENPSTNSSASALQSLPVSSTIEPMTMALDPDLSQIPSPHESERSRTTTTVPLALPTISRPATRQYRFIYLNDSDNDETLPVPSSINADNSSIIVSNNDELPRTTTTRSRITSSSTNATTRTRNNDATSPTNETSNYDSSIARVRLNRAIEIVIDSIQSLEGAVNNFDQLVFGLIYSRIGSNNFDGIEGMIRLSRILNLPTRLTQTEIDSLPKIVFVNKIPTSLRNDNEKEKCPVCLTEFDDGETINKLRCSHMFHLN
ncbi:unnamed protein product, partial [Didymodactylos carnosus]